jgi:hypothetical protein
VQRAYSTAIEALESCLLSLRGACVAAPFPIMLAALGLENGSPTMDCTQIPVTTPEPVFIHGILQRSGTNYLMDLLLLHEECQSGGIFEDYFVASSSLLLRYLRTVTESWDPKWFSESRETMRGQLARSIGLALLKFAMPEGPRRRYFVSKTPSTLNVHSVFDLFPKAKVILIVRDGRDVVESGVRSFGWEWEPAVREWRLSAERIMNALSQSPNRQQMLLVRYEDLFIRTREEALRILEFLGLDAARYDFQAAGRLQVRGSCEFGRRSGGDVTWDPVPRSSDFAPVGRHFSWPLWRQRRFEHLAGEISAALGYNVRVDVAQTPLSSIRGRVQDWLCRLRLRASDSLFLVARAIMDPKADFSTDRWHYYERQIRHPKRPPLLPGTAGAGSTPDRSRLRADNRASG